MKNTAFPDHAVIPGVQGPRLVVHGKVGKLRKKDIDLGRQPRPVPARIMPRRTGEKGLGRSHGIQGRVGPIKIFLAARREDAEQAASMGQDQQPRAIAKGEGLGMTARTAENFLQIAQTFHSRFGQLLIFRHSVRGETMPNEIINVLRKLCICFCPFSSLFSDGSETPKPLGTYSASWAKRKTAGFSTPCRTCCRKRAAGAPSTTR